MQEFQWEINVSGHNLQDMELAEAGKARESCDQLSARGARCSGEGGGGCGATPESPLCAGHRQAAATLSWHVRTNAVIPRTNPDTDYSLENEDAYDQTAKVTRPKIEPPDLH